jgi:hypothetical protein
MVEVQLTHGTGRLLPERNEFWRVSECYRAGGIRTRGLLHPRQALYQAEPQPELHSARPRSNRRAHLFRVLRALRQDRISEQLRSERRNRQVVCTRIGRLPVETAAPNQTSKQSTWPAKYALLRRTAAAKNLCTRNRYDQTNNWEESAHFRDGNDASVGRGNHRHIGRTLGDRGKLDARG